MFTRKCPECGREIQYKDNYWCRYAEKRKSKCKSCNSKGSNNSFYGKKHTEESRKKMRAGDRSYAQTKEFKEKMSAVTSSTKNGMYGRSNYKIWLEKYGKDKADELNAEFKRKLSVSNRGKGNPMYGRPSPMGSGVGWKGWYKGWFFRSLRELSYVINVIEKNNWGWASAESNELSMPYVDWQGVPRTYRADFIVENTRLIEVKPTKLKSSIAVIAKQQAAILFCKAKNLTYELVDPPIMSNEQIRDLYSSNKIKFTAQYEALFKEKFLCRK